LTGRTTSPLFSHFKRKNLMARRRKIQPLGAAGQALQRTSRAMVDGVGGIQFTAQSPPGIGRLIRIPFYMFSATPGFDALIGQVAAAIPAAGGTASAIYPAILMQPPAAAGSTVTATMRTPQISWAVLRVVGFECNVQEPVLPAGVSLECAFSDLKIGGGANLFVHEDFAPGSIYLMGQLSFAGLRDYPVLRSPNQAEVQVQGLGTAVSFPKTFSCNLVAEVLVDDNYGAHVPGAYARPGALVRQGGSFVTG
jgi:hypothetical protein